MKFREHRGSLAEAMGTVVDLENGDALVDHVTSLLSHWGYGRSYVERFLRCQQYQYDPRIGWDTWLITLEGYGVIGFTDGQPL
jgi:hypothetical protein